MKKHSRFRIFALFLSIMQSVLGQAALSAQAIPYGSSPNIVVTVKPLHSLVATITAGVTEPRLLLTGGSSPHTYALRPSDSEALQTADAIFRMSENLEGFLNRPLKSLSAKATVINADQSPDLSLLGVRGAGTFDKQAATSAPGPISSRDADVHIWLDVRNAIAIAGHITQNLERLDPANATRYRENATRLKTRLVSLDTEIAVKMKPFSAKPFIVFHDVTQYYERRYGLYAAGAITVSPERQPGANRIAAIRSKIKELGAVCIFSEPQFPPQLVETVAEGTAAKRGILDEIGSAIAPGPDHYFTFMQTVAESFSTCLSG